jgi:hypothetical protein
MRHSFFFQHLQFFPSLALGKKFFSLHFVPMLYTLSHPSGLCLSDSVNACHTFQSKENQREAQENVVVVLSVAGL